MVHHLVFYLGPAQLPLPLLTLSGFCNLSGSSLLVYSCGGALWLGWRCLWCVAWFSTLCSALPPGPAVCAAYPAAGSLGDFLPFLSPGACPSASLVAQVGQQPFPSFFCASPAPAGLQGFAGFCTLCQGAPVGVVSALWATVSSSCLLSLTLGWVSFWTAVSTVSVSCKVCRLGCLSWFVLLFMSVCPSPALGLGWFGNRSVAPPAAPGCWALLESRLRRSDAFVYGRTLSFYFLAGVFFFGRLLGLGLVGCDPALVPTFFWGNSPSLVRVFAGRFLLLGCPVS